MRRVRRAWISTVVGIHVPSFVEGSSRYSTGGALACPTANYSLMHVRAGFCAGQRGFCAALNRFALAATWTFRLAEHMLSLLADEVL